ncbi:PHP-associated domain-containing protein [Paenibacillus sp. FA6]|uniref:PHP-associated domain-containing protein n=1 Tax=Paenibacillus sp. FA6 TaxID=3413029 RepID=UPI003F658C52
MKWSPAREHILYPVLTRLDAFDLNGRDLHHCGLDMEGKVSALAELIELPVIAGSDTHQPLQFGSVYNQFEQSCDTIDQLRNAIRLGAYDYHISQHLHSKVKSAEVEQARYKMNM